MTDSVTLVSEWIEDGKVDRNRSGTIVLAAEDTLTQVADMTGGLMLDVALPGWQWLVPELHIQGPTVTCRLRVVSVNRDDYGKVMVMRYPVRRWWRRFLARWLA